MSVTKKNSISQVEKVLLESEWANLIQDFHGMPIPFDNDWKNIAIDMSGGIDSTLLNFLIADHITKNKLTTNIHVITNLRKWSNSPWQQFYAENMYDLIRKKFPNINYTLDTAFLPPELEGGVIGAVIPFRGNLCTGDSVVFGQFASYVCYKYSCEAKFSATTANPIFLQEFPGHPWGRNLSLNNGTKPEIKNLVNIKRTEMRAGFRPSFIDPFVFYEKDIIVSLYKNLGLLDLLTETRSCEGGAVSIYHATKREFDNGIIDSDPSDKLLSDPLLGYKKGDYLGQCGECFWCREKKWALAENNL